MDKKYRIVTESGKVLLGGETYTRGAAESWWNDMNGMYEDEDSGKTERIFIEEV